MGQVTCSACGYLGRRPEGLVQLPIPSDLLPVSHDTRESGVGRGALVCFKEEPDFDREAICRPRDCKSYYSWNPGYNPKEHAMLELHEQELQAQKAEGRADRLVMRLALGVSIVSLIAVIILGLLNYFG